MIDRIYEISDNSYLLVMFYEKEN